MNWKDKTELAKKAVLVDTPDLKAHAAHKLLSVADLVEAHHDHTLAKTLKNSHMVR